MISVINLMKNWHNLLKNKVFVVIDLPRIVEIEYEWIKAIPKK